MSAQTIAPIPTQTTRIARSAGATRLFFAFFVGGFAVFAITLALLLRFPTVELPIIPIVDFDFNYLPVILLVGGGAAGLLGAFGLVFASFVAPCPACGALLDTVSSTTNSPFPCAQCDRFVEGAKRLLWVVEESRVERRPSFRAPLITGDGVPFARTCVVCGEPATRDIKVTWSAPVQDITAKNSYRSEDHALSVPHCSAHDDGALVLQGTDSGPAIYFRSLPTARAYCASHGVRASSQGLA